MRIPNLSLYLRMVEFEFETEYKFEFETENKIFHEYQPRYIITSKYNLEQRISSFI